MRRKLLLGGGLAAVALALAVLVLVVPVRTPSNRVVLDQRPGAVLPATETTLRNVTREPVTYTILPNSRSPLPRTRTLRVDALDRIPTDIDLEVSFYNKARTEVNTVVPGMPYSFRYNESDLIQLYPGSHGREDALDLAPWVPTPQGIVEQMLALAKVGPSDVVYDLGCGDGRMIVAAAKEHGARGVGVDIDPEMVRQSKENAERAGVADRVRFYHEDAIKVDIHEATVLSLYLLPESLELLRPRFERQLRPGARIVSHNYKIPGWDEKLKEMREVNDEDSRRHVIYLYVR